LPSAQRAIQLLVDGLLVGAKDAPSLYVLSNCRGARKKRQPLRNTSRVGCNSTIQRKKDVAFLIASAMTEVKSSAV